MKSENGDVNITAKANTAIFNISAGAGVGGAAGLQGSVSVNYLETGVSAYITDAVVEVGGDIILQALTEKRTTIPKSALQAEWVEGEVSAFDGGGEDEGEEESLETQPNSPDSLTNIQSIAGAVAGGGGASIGAAIAVNHLENIYSAYIIGSTVTAVGDVILKSESLGGIETVSAAAAGSGGFAAAGSVSLNFIKNTILAYISSSTVTAGNPSVKSSIKVEAQDTSTIKSVSGQINFSGTTGLGAAAAYNEIANTIKAYVDKNPAGSGSVLTAGDDILIQSKSAATISTIAASGSLGVYFGGSATVVINLITNQVLAYINNTQAIAEGDLYILAESLNETNCYAGSAGGGAVGAGAAVIVNVLNNTTKAYVQQSSVIARGNGNSIIVANWDDDGNRLTSGQSVHGLIIIAHNQEAITVYSGSIGVGLAGISGQISSNIITNVTEAYIDSSDINTDTDKGQWVIIRANQITSLRIYAGSLAVGGTAAGGAVDATVITNTTKAYLKDSAVYAGSGLEVKAITSLKPLGDLDQPAIIVAGASLSAAYSLAGAVSVIVTNNTNEAFIKCSEVLTPGSIKVLSSHNIDIDVYGGTVAGSAYVGAGGTVVVSSFKNISRAQIIGSKLNASGAIEIKARSRDKINVLVGTAGIGITGAGAAGAISVTLVETTTEASILRDEATGKNSEINQDARFRPGGSYAPVNSTSQTISILADNKTTVDTIGGALGAGTYLGLGAAVDYVSIQNRTVAMIGTGSKLYARGNITLESLSEKIVDSKVYSTGLGLFGISGAVSIICVGSPISSDGSGEFNSDLRNQINNDISPHSRLNYKDDAGNSKSRLPGDSIGQKAAAAINGATGPNVTGALDPDLNTANKITAAFVQNATGTDSRAEIVSGETVTIHALDKNDLSSQPNNAAAGAIAAGGTVAYIFTAGNTKAYLGDYGYLRANNIVIKAEAFAKADAHTKSAGASLIGGVHVYLAYADVQPVVEAYFGNNSDVVVLNSIQIDAEVTPDVNAKVQGVTVAGAVDVGMSKAEAKVKPQVTAWIGDYARIIAGPQPVSGNPALTLISRGKLTGKPGLEFKSNSIVIDGKFVFERGVVLSGQPELEFNSADSTITRTDEGSWMTDGFQADMNIIISGTWLNDGTYTISDISSDGKVLTLADGIELTDETTGSNQLEELEGSFTLGNNEDGMLTLTRTDGEAGWKWADQGLLLGDYVKITIGGELHSYEITGLRESSLILALYVGEMTPENHTQVTLEKVAREISVRAEGNKANDRVTYKGGESLQAQGLNEGSYFMILLNDSGYNSGVYEIIGFENDGFTAILDTMGYVRNTQEGTEETGQAIREISSELTRTTGSWLEDGFKPGDIICVSGAQYNNGYYQIKEISADGKKIIFYKGDELTDETISAGSSAAVTSLSNDRIIRDSGSWEADGFMPGQVINIAGSKLPLMNSNNGNYIIKAISADGKELILEVQDRLKKETSNELFITIEGDYDSSLEVSAKVLLPSSGVTAQADAEGISGSILASVNGIYATAKVNTIVNAYIGNNANLNVLGLIDLYALANTKQVATTDSINFGALSISYNKAVAAATSCITASIGENTVIRGNDLKVTAYGDENNYAQAISGAGGLISGQVTEAETSFNPGDTGNYGTKATIGSGAQINVGLFTLLAEHILQFNSRVDTTNASIVGGSGTLAKNTVRSDVNAVIAANAVINAYNILVTAVNEAEKDWLSDDKDNVNSGSGGIADFPASRSHTDIVFRTNVTVGDGAELNVIGDPFNPGSLTLNAVNRTLAKDKVELKAGAAIEIASAESKIWADVYDAAVNIGNNALLNSVGDINLSALAWAEIETKVDVATWGAASAANGATLSRVKAVNTITVNNGAKLFAEGMVNLMVSQDSNGQMGNLDVKAVTSIDNNGVLPVSTTPSADGIINLTDYINIKSGALIQSVGDTNLIAQMSPTLAEGKATGHDWIRSAFGAEIKGGTGAVNRTPLVRVDGTVEVGLRSQQILIIKENGDIDEENSSDGIIVTRDKVILADHILNEIKYFYDLAVQYAGTEAGTAFANQAKFLEQELQRMGITYNSDEPIPIVWIDLIIVNSIKAEQPNINVLAEGGSLVGNGVLNASKNPALIKIINNSPHYLVLNNLHIPEREGGLLFYNYDAVSGSNLNQVINSRNKSKEANFTISTSASSGSASSEIYVENTYGGSTPPGIDILGSIKNIGVQGNPGKVTIKSQGGIFIYNSIDAGDLQISASGSFMQSYTDSLFNVGGSPRAIWGHLATYMQKFTIPYPYKASFYWPVNPFDQVRIDREIDDSLNNTNTGAIRADNIFIAARYLNINGIIEAGRPINVVTINSDSAIIAKINQYKNLISMGLLRSTNFKDYPLLQNEIGLKLYYDPARNAIVVDSLAVRGGYVELFGQIINTGTGKITALDGYGKINIDNQTSYDLIIKGLDTGYGAKGIVIITDTAKKKTISGKETYLTTQYQRAYVNGTYQITTETWYSDQSGVKHNYQQSEASGSSAVYNPVEGYRYEWVMGQEKALIEIYTYRTSSWMGADWLAKDPDDLYESTTYNIGTPVLMPDGEYLTYRPGDKDQPYIYWYERHSNDYKLVGQENWTEQSWFMAKKYYYYEYTYREGYIDVYYHSIKADYPIDIEFAGERQGSINITSQGNIIIEGLVKNESGNTIITAGGAIRSNSDQPITTRNLVLTAGTGIGGSQSLYIPRSWFSILSGFGMNGGSRPLNIALSGYLWALTTEGDINIKETKGNMVLGGNITAYDGNVRLEARIGISANNKDIYFIKGNTIELVTASGAIQGELGSPDTALRIDTADAAGFGLKAQAGSNINLEEISGSLRVISVICQSGTDLGDVTLKVANGNLLNSGEGDYAPNASLLSFWEQEMSGENTIRNLAAFLEKVYLKRLTGTNCREYMANIIGNNITLNVQNNVGSLEEIHVDFVDGQAQLDEELMAMLVSAEPGDVSFYDADGNKLDPSGPGSSAVAYLIIKTPRYLVLQGDGSIIVNAGGSVYLYSDEDMHINTVSADNGGAVRVKSASGIFNAADTSAVNIRGGDILLEAAGGSIGLSGTPLTIQQRSEGSLRARSGYDIYLQGVQGTYNSYNYTGDLALDFIYTPGSVHLKSDSAIIDDRNDDQENIAADSLTIEAASAGQNGNYLELDLMEPTAGEGKLNVTAVGNSYLTEVDGNMYIGLIQITNGDLCLKADGSIYGSAVEGAAIEAENINLTALNGTIGQAEKNLLIDTKDPGMLTASAKEDIYIEEVSGNLILNSVASTTGSAHLKSAGSILNGNPVGGVNISADKATLIAGANIGDVVKALLTEVNKLEAEAQNGSIWLHNKKNLAVDGQIKSESGDIKLIIDGSIMVSSATALITARNLTITAATGIGGSQPLYIALAENGVLNAETTGGNINIKETLGSMLLGGITAHSGNVKLEAQTGIAAANKGTTLIRGNLIELVTTSGSIQGEAGSPGAALRIDTTDGEGFGLKAQAGSNINLEEISGSLRVISIICQSGTARGDVTLKVNNGSLLNPNNGIYNINPQLSYFWNEKMEGENTALNLAAFLEKVYLKRLTDTKCLHYPVNIIGRNITLDVQKNVGSLKEFQINFVDDLADLNDELKAMLVSAEPGDVSFYDADGNQVDPTGAGVTVAYLKINAPRHIVLRGDGKLTVNAGGSIYLYSDQDMQLNTVSADNGGAVRIKSAQGIFNAADAAAVNIRGGDILLEAAGGSLGVFGTPLTIQQRSGDSLRARSGYDIYLQGVQGSYKGTAYTGDLALDFIYTAGGVNLKADSSVVDARNDGKENIAADSLVIEAASVGQSANYLEIDLAEPLAGQGNLSVFAVGHSYLTEVNGNMHIDLIRITNGDLYLKAEGSIYGCAAEGPAIQAVNLNLTALNGAIGQVEKNLLIDTKAPGTLIATAKGDIYIGEVSGNLILDSVASTTGNISLKSAGSILNGNPSGAVNISADQAALISGGNIGVVERYLQTEVNKLEVEAQNGSIWLHNNKNLIIGDFTEMEGFNIGGSVNLTVFGSLTVKESITAAGQIVVTTTGSIVIGAPIKNKSGDTSLTSTDGAIMVNSGDTLITARNLTLKASTGIGAAGSPLPIALVHSGVLKAETADGDINIKETQGNMLLGGITAHGGNVRLEAQTGISAINKDLTLIKGNTIELVTASGAIQGEAGSPSAALRIDTADGEGFGLKAQAGSNINLEEISGSLRVISVICQSGTDLGDVTLKVTNGSLLNPSNGNYDENPELLNFWNEKMSGGNNAANLAAFLEKVYLKRLTDTNFMAYPLNIIGDNITLNVQNNVGSLEEIRVNFADGQAQLDEVLKAMLVSAERGDVSFYDAAGNLVDPTGAGVTVAYLTINVPRYLVLRGEGKLTVNAGGLVYLYSDEDMKLNTVSADNGGAVRVKSAKGIFNAADAVAVNIRGGDIFLEAAGGSIGALASPLRVQQLSLKSINARSGYDIHLQGVHGTYNGTVYNGALALDFIYTPGSVHLKTDFIVIDARNDDKENIAAGSLVIEAMSVGQDGNYLDLDLMEPLTGQGNFSITAMVNSYLTEVNGNMHIGLIQIANGDLYLKADGSIYGCAAEGPAIKAVNLNLTALNGAIGQAGKILLIDTKDPGMLTATAKGNIYIEEVSGNLILNSVVSTTGNIHLKSAGNILNGNPVGGANISADQAALISGGNIGAVERYLQTEVNKLEAEAQNGSIWLHNTKDLVIGDVTGMEGLSASDSVILLVSGNLKVTEIITAGTTVDLKVHGSLEVRQNITAEENVILTTVDTSSPNENRENILILAGVTIWSRNGAIELRAGDNIVLQAGSLLKAGNQVSLRVDYSTDDPDPGVGGSLELYGEIQALLLAIYGGVDNDTILIQTDSSLPHTDIKTGAGNDQITLDKLKPILSQYEGGRSTVNLDGGEGKDHFIINLSGLSSYIINIHDSGAGVDDILTINATENNDQILIRQNFIALINQGLDLDGDGYDDVERINYNLHPEFNADAVGGLGTWTGCTLEMVIINTLDGDDYVVSDDTSTCFTINGGMGNDKFQVGQVFNSARDALAGIAAGDLFRTLETTQGFLSRGISFMMIINGGDVNDQFSVYHNKAELFVNGEGGNDKFLVRAFVVVDDSGDQQRTNIVTGDGINEITYAINAPVNIDGGGGFNSLIIILTEYDDYVVVDKDKIYGAGVTATYTNIQYLEIDGLAGNDTFYILGTASGIETVIIGGLGSDTFIIAGDITPGKVMAVDEEGNPVILPDPTHQTSSIQGKLTLIGGQEGVDHSLSKAVTLPKETNHYIPTGTTEAIGGNTLTDEEADFSSFKDGVAGCFLGLLDDQGQVTQIRRIESLNENTLILDLPWDPLPSGPIQYVILYASPGLNVDETTQTDRLLVYNDKSTTDDHGEMQTDPTSGINTITGLNMGPGIEYLGLEGIEIWLGKGHDTFIIHDTVQGTPVEIQGGAGNDTIIVEKTRDNLVLNGNDGNDYFNLLFDNTASGDIIVNGNRGDDYFNLEFGPGYLEHVILNGNEGHDTFSFADGVILNGAIYGGEGLDTLDFSRYTTARHISILGWDNSGYYGVQSGSTAGPECAILDGFTGIKRVIGSSSATEIDGDKLYSILEESGLWILDGDNSIYKAIRAIDDEGNPITLNFRNYDFLYGSNLDDSFTMVGQEYGRLFGWAGHDSFILLDGASLNGDIDGGGGDNTLDYRAYTTDVIVNLGTFSATNISRSIIGINIVYGGQGNDHLIGDNGDNILASTGGNDILEGKYGNNTYLIYEGFDTVRIIETLLGQDTLDFSNVTSELIFELNDKKVNKITDGTITGSVNYGEDEESGKSIKGDKIKTFIGGSGKSSFILKAGYVLPEGTRLDGGPGFGIIDFSNYGGARDIKLTAAETGGFAGEQAAIPGGFVRIDKIIGDLINKNTLSGMDEDSTYTFGQILDLSSGEYVDYHTVSVNGIILVIENYQNIKGGNGKDTFAFVGSGKTAGSIDGGGGLNTLDYSRFDLGDMKGVKVDLLLKQATGVGGGLGNKVYNIRKIIGSDYDDILLADNQDNILIGGSGNDRLEGRGGNNTYIFNGDWGEDVVVNSSGQGALDFSSLAESLTAILPGYLKADLSTWPTIGYGLNTVKFDGLSLIKTGSGNDVFDISGSYSMGIESGAGDDTYNFSGTGTLNGNINSGAGDDTFKFADKARVLGTIDGGAGYNTLDFSLYSTSLNINLAAMQVKTPGLNGTEVLVLNKFNNIHKLIGSSIAGQNDTLTGPNADALFKITGENSGDVSWNSAENPAVIITIDFESIENLKGGNGKDTFKIIGSGHLTGSLNGGAGNNTLDYGQYDLGDNSGVTVNLNSGTATAIGGGAIGMLSGIQNLVSSHFNDIFTGHNTENNTFIFEDSWANDQINPGGGLNTLDFSRLTANIIITLDSSQEIIDSEILTHFLAEVKETDPDSGALLNSLLVTWDKNNNLLKEIYGSQGENKFFVKADYAVSLYGGASDDSFYLDDQITLTGLIDGKGGINTLDLSLYSTARDITLTGLGTLSGFNGSEKSITQGFRNISSLLASESAEGDSLTGFNEDSTFTLDATYSGADIWNKYLNLLSGRLLAFTNLEILKGGSGAVTFRISGEQMYDLYGGAGHDIFSFADEAKLISNSHG